MEEGSVNTESTDWWGNKTIINHVEKGSMLLEVYALSGRVLMVDLIAS